MAGTELFGLSIGLFLFFSLAGLYERYRPDQTTEIVLLSFGIGSFGILYNNTIENESWRLATVVVPNWVSEVAVVLPIVFFAFPGYVVWRWATDSPDRPATEKERQLYEYRWGLYGFSVLMGIVFVVVLLLTLYQSI